MICELSNASVLEVLPWMFVPVVKHVYEHTHGGQRTYSSVTLQVLSHQPIALMGQGWLTSNSQEPISFPGMGLQV